MVEITEAAAKKIIELVERSNMREKGGLLFAVIPGGCSGMQYQVEPEAEPLDGDQVFERELDLGGVKKTARVFVDPNSLLYVDGSVIDYGYVPDLLGEGFKIANPNEQGSCGCGKSFTA